jgi:glycosyltransferase 2 family protein
MKKRFLQYIVSAVVTFGFLYATYRNADPERLLASLQQVNYWWIGAMLIVLVFSDYLRAIRWGYMLKPVKRSMGKMNLFSSIMIGYLLNNLLPRVGEVSRSIALARMESISVSSVLAATAAERLLDMMTLALLLVLLPIAYQSPLGSVFPWLAEAQTLATIFSIAAIVGILVVVFSRRLTERFITVILRPLPEKFGLRLRGIAGRFLDGLMFLRDPSTFLPIFLYTVPIWGLYVLMHYAGFLAFGLEGRLTMSAALVVLTISTVGVAIPSPGGTGTFHFFMVAALTGLYSVTPETAMSLAAVEHAAMFVGTSLVGLGFFLKDQRKLAGFFRLTRGVENGGSEPRQGMVAEGKTFSE